MCKFLTVASVVLIAGCADRVINCVTAPSSGFVQRITIAPTTINLKVGQQSIPTVTVVAQTGASSDYACTSTNTAFAIVVPGTKCTVKLVAGYVVGAVPIPEIVATSVDSDENGNKLSAGAFVLVIP